jgi:hypothetical protein
MTRKKRWRNGKKRKGPVLYLKLKCSLYVARELLCLVSIVVGTVRTNQVVYSTWIPDTGRLVVHTVMYSQYIQY